MSLRRVEANHDYKLSDIGFAPVPHEGSGHDNGGEHRRSDGNDTSTNLGGKTGKLYDHDALEVSADEKLEEEQDAKIRCIQKKIRSRRARRFVRDLVISAFAKEYDYESGVFYYRNKRTGATQRKKPLALGDDDLPDPTIYYAPTGYKTTPSPFRQFALVVHCTEFADRKLPNLPKCLNNDHRTIRQVIVNPYLMKYREEDCIFSLNATTKAVLASLQMLLKKIQIASNIEKAATGNLDESQLVVFIYVSTHSIQITKSVRRATYFCFTDTNASSPRLLRQTSISVRQFTEILAKIECQSKFVVIDCCHSERPADSFLKVLKLYPQYDLYRTIANKGKCLVLGSCKLGLSSGDATFVKPTNETPLRFHRRLWLSLCNDIPSRRRPANHLHTVIKDGEIPFADKSRGRGENNNEGWNIGDSMYRRSSVNPRGHEKSKSVLDTRCLLENIPSFKAACVDEAANPATTSSAASRLNNATPQKDTKFLTVCLAEEGQKLLRKFSLPKMRMMVDPTGKYYVVDEIDQIRSWPRLFRQRVYMRVSNACAVLKRRVRERLDRSSVMRSQHTSSYEVACYGKHHSAFGGALIRAVQGHATALPELRLSARLVCAHVSCDVAQSLNDVTENATNESSQCRGDANRQNVARGALQKGTTVMHPRFQTGFSSNNTNRSISKRRQTPQIAASRVIGEQFAISTVGCVPSVPPAPHAPRSLTVRDRTALLSWENPVFSGAPPIQYELQYCDTANSNSKDWSPCCSFATITTNAFPIPHLVPGFGVRFRVRARNFGGWGQWSEPSDRIVPIERTVVCTAVGMRLTASKGLPKVIEAMQNLATSSEAQKLGASQLIAVAVKPGGFKRACHARDSAKVIMQAMHTFLLDAEMQAKGCLLLGWCFYKHKSVAIQYGQAASRIVSRACSNFPSNIAVVSNAMWASSHLSCLPASATQPSMHDTDLLTAVHSGKIQVKAGAR